MHDSFLKLVLFEQERRLPRRPPPRGPLRPIRNPKRNPRFTRRVQPGRR